MKHEIMKTTKFMMCESKVSKVLTTNKVTAVNSVLERRLRILTNKYHYRTEITFNWSYVLSCTLQGLKADIVHFMNMSQHKRFAFMNWTMWRNDYIITMG